MARARQDGAVGLLPQAPEYLAPVELVGGRLDAAEALERAAARGLGLPATLAGHALATLELG